MGIQARKDEDLNWGRSSGENRGKNFEKYLVQLTGLVIDSKQKPWKGGDREDSDHCDLMSTSVGDAGIKRGMGGEHFGGEGC